MKSVSKLKILEGKRKDGDGFPCLEGLAQGLLGLSDCLGLKVLGIISELISKQGCYAPQNQHTHQHAGFWGLKP